MDATTNTAFIPCGVETPKGPCTMIKGHAPKWHRHSAVSRTIWQISYKHDGVIKTEYGRDRVPLNYAISNLMRISDKLVVTIRVERDGETPPAGLLSDPRAEPPARPTQGEDDSAGR